MKKGRFQAKDIDDVFFLRCVDWCSMHPEPPNILHGGKKPSHYPLDQLPHWVFMWNLEAMMPMFPEEVILSKARRLEARGLIKGCTCGCRGDFELTEEGRATIRAAGFELHQDGPAAAERLGLERQLASVDWTTARYEVIGLDGTTLKGRLIAQTRKP
jgi:hypothetical protein